MLETVEELVRNSRARLCAERPSIRRQVGSYNSELDILQSMLNEHGSDVRVKFKPSSSQASVEVLPNENVNEEATVVISNPDGLKETEIEVRRHWLS